MAPENLPRPGDRNCFAIRSAARHVSQFYDQFLAPLGLRTETFASHDMARRAAERAAKERVVPGNATGISYEDKDGRWHDELSEGDDRPETERRGLREASIEHLRPSPRRDRLARAVIENSA